MRYSASLFCLVGVFSGIQGIAFGGVALTASGPEHVVDDTAPKPTKNPLTMNLRKRQAYLGQETCGWVDGDYVQSMTCPGALTCMLYKSAAVGMVGCCSGSDSQDCGWSSSCIDAEAYAAGKCDSNCIMDGFVSKCTAATAPYCVTWSYPSDGIRDYGCTDVSSNTVYTVLQRMTDVFGDTTSIELPLLGRSAVTGYDGSGSGSNVHKTGKTVAIGLIVGVVIAGLFVLFCVIVGVCFFLKKKKKQRQIAANAQIVAAAQVNRPRSYYPPTQHQPPTMPPQQTPHSSGYLPSPSQLEQKNNVHLSVCGYTAPSILSPPTPAPAYVQPQYNSVPATPSSPTPVVNQRHNAESGAHEVDAISVPRPPTHGGPVYEIGQER